MTLFISLQNDSRLDDVIITGSSSSSSVNRSREGLRLDPLTAERDVKKRDVKRERLMLKVG
jgi:hypothetical protein